MTEDGQHRWIALGVIARPHGVRGEVRVHPFNPDSELLSRGEEVFVRREAEDPRPVSLVSVRPGPRAWLVRMRGVETREAADALRGAQLCVPRASLPELEEGEYYYADLIGLRAFERGKPIGEVVDVLDYPSVECLKIRSADGFLEVPMLPPWLDRVDLDQREVHLYDLDEIPRQRSS